MLVACRYMLSPIRISGYNECLQTPRFYFFLPLLIIYLLVLSILNRVILYYLMSHLNHILFICDFKNLWPNAQSEDQIHPLQILVTVRKRHFCIWMTFLKCAFTTAKTAGSVPHWGIVGVVYKTINTLLFL